MAINHKAAKEFAKRWQGQKWSEDQYARTFWIDLLKSVYDIEYNDTNNVIFEYRTGANGKIDLWLRNLSTMVEMKSSGVDLDKPEPRQGELKTPFKQVYDYAVSFPRAEQPDFLITCNFEKFRIYSRKEYGDTNLENNGQEFTLEMFGEKPEYLSFLIDPQNSRLYHERAISEQAGQLIGKLYNMLRKQYIDPDSEESKHSLNVLCVRLVFCLFCEDAGLFNEMDAFYNFLKDVPSQNIRANLLRLFKALDTKKEERSPYDPLEMFPYVNGGLFRQDVEIPSFTDEIKDFLLYELSQGVDWSKISPTIFGGIFESTLNPDTRRKGGMHYTTPENIHKVIDPLFLDDLKAEFAAIRDDKGLSVIQKRNRYKKFRHKLSTLKFLDPAAGSGNFLTETYICLRQLEFAVMSEQKRGKNIEMYSSALGEETEERVKLSQFYGIEINDFAVSVAETALWISRLKANAEAVIVYDLDEKDFPLEEAAMIIHANALRTDWNSVVSADDIDYIIGNPPFVGQARRTAEQSVDMKEIFGEGASETKLDYVLCWYKKSLDYIKNTSKPIEVAFVSTNSICQGESIPAFWKNIITEGLCINFAYRSFEWESESSDSAAVSCVIVGFSLKERDTKKLFVGNDVIIANHINPYLIDFEDIWLVSRSNTPPPGMPKLIKGSEPTDCRGNLFLSSEEREYFLAKYPELEPYIRPFVGGDEFTNNLSQHYDRYCFWFDNVDVSKFDYIQELTDRFSRIAEARRQSTADRIQKRAVVPHLFCQIRQPNTQYVVFPRHTSSNYSYLPLGYLTPEIIVGDACYILSDAPLYLFGVLESSIHKYWVELVAGRLGDAALRYTPAVYNNFPWVRFSDAAKERIAETAQKIIESRNNHLDQSLSHLYDPGKMPKDLEMAHYENDKAVLDAYGFSYNMTEPEIVAELMKLYQNLTKEE